MISDITLGQYLPKESAVHSLDPRTKLVLTIVYIIALFVVSNPLGYLLALVFTFLLYAISKVPIKMVLKNLKPVIPVLIFTGILNLFFVSSGDILASFWIFRITTGGLKLAFTMAFRIMLLISGASILTYTTLPIALTDGIENLLSPLKKIRFPSHEFAMMMTIALRFVPTIIDETQKIISAQKARGADMETGGVIKRAKAFIPVLIPLFVSSFRRAEELAMAMEARCYKGGEGRTRLKQLKFSIRDLYACLVMSLFLIAVITLNIYVPNPF